MSNVALDRLCARMLAAALNLNEAAEGIEGREAITLAEIDELKGTIDACARSLNLCSSIIHYCSDDMLQAGITAEVVDKRAGADFEARALTTIRKALAGEATQA